MALVLFFDPDKLLQLSVELLDRVFGNAVAARQRRDLGLEGICAGNSGRTPIDKLEGLLVVLLECYGAQSLLRTVLDKTVRPRGNLTEVIQLYSGSAFV